MSLVYIHSVQINGLTFDIVRPKLKFVFLLQKRGNPPLSEWLIIHDLSDNKFSKVIIY